MKHVNSLCSKSNVCPFLINKLNHSIVLTLNDYSHCCLDIFVTVSVQHKAPIKNKMYSIYIQHKLLQWVQSNIHILCMLKWVLCCNRWFQNFASTEIFFFFPFIFKAATDGPRGAHYSEGTPRCMDSCRYNIGILYQPADKILRPSDIGECYQDKMEGATQDSV